MHTWTRLTVSIITCFLILLLFSPTGLEPSLAAGDEKETHKAFYLKIGDKTVLDVETLEEIPDSITSEQAGMDSGLFTLTKNTDSSGMTLSLEGSQLPEQLDEDTSYDELDIKTIGSIIIRGFNAMKKDGSGSFTITQRDEHATMISGGDTGRVYGEDEEQKPALTAIDADGNLQIRGDSKSTLVLFGGIYCGGTEDKSIAGNLNITGSNLTILGMSFASSDAAGTKADGGNMVAVFGAETAGGANLDDGSFSIDGGTLTAIGLGDDWDALQIQGDMNVNNGGFHQILSIFGNGGTVSGVLKEGQNGQFLVGSTLGRGLVVQNVKENETAVDLRGIQSVLLGVIDMDQAGNSSQSQSPGDPVCGLLVQCGGVSVSGSGTHMAVSAGVNEKDAGLKLEGNGTSITKDKAKISVSGRATLMAVSAMGQSGAIVLPDLSGGAQQDAANLIIEDDSTVTAIGLGRGITASGISVKGTTLDERGSLNAYACDTINTDEFINVDGIKEQADRLENNEAVFLTDSNGLININPEISSIGLSNNDNGVQTAAASSPDKAAIYTYGQITVDGGSLCAMAYGSDDSESTVAVNAGGIALLQNTPIVTALAEGGKISGVNGIRIRNTAMGSKKLELKAGAVFTAYGKAGKSILLDGEASMSLDADPAASANVAYGNGPSNGSSETISEPVDKNAKYGKWINAPYFYCVPGDAATHIDDKSFITWDYMDKGTAAFVAAFDPPTGKNRVSKEMMRILQGIRTSTVMICSDNTDFSKDGFMASYADAYSQSAALDPENPNAPIYTSLIIKGTGAGNERSRGIGYMFKTGLLYKDAATGSMTRMQLKNGTGDYYDFGSRYDTAPEYEQINELTEKNIIHSVHFNYPDKNPGETKELPVETQLLVLLGEDYKECETDWVFMKEGATQLDNIGSYRVDPFGGLSVDINKIYKNTAFLTDAGPAPAPDGRDGGTSFGADTGDSGLPLAAMVMLFISALGIIALLINVRRLFFNGH